MQWKREKRASPLSRLSKMKSKRFFQVVKIKFDYFLKLGILEVGEKNDSFW